MRSLVDARVVGGVLEGIGCDWLVLKGQALAEDLYPGRHLRFGVDIDVLVESHRFADALNALRTNGWTLLDRNWPLFAWTVPGELRLRSGSGTLLDLHWHWVRLFCRDAVAA